MPDVFISHASEDKESIVRPLADALKSRGCEVWLDETTLRLGDRLRREIDRGLAACRFGVVVLSPDFFSKEWPQIELDGLLSREVTEREKRILPVWHNLTAKDVAKYSPILADRVGVSTSRGLEPVVKAILDVVLPTKSVQASSANANQFSRSIPSEHHKETAPFHRDDVLTRQFFVAEEATKREQEAEREKAAHLAAQPKVFIQTSIPEAYRVFAQSLEPFGRICEITEKADTVTLNVSFDCTVELAAHARLTWSNQPELKVSRFYGITADPWEYNWADDYAMFTPETHSITNVVQYLTRIYVTSERPRLKIAKRELSANHGGFVAFHQSHSPESRTVYYDAVVNASSDSMFVETLVVAVTYSSWVTRRDGSFCIRRETLRSGEYRLLHLGRFWSKITSARIDARVTWKNRTYSAAARIPVGEGVDDLPPFVIDLLPE